MIQVSSRSVIKLNMKQYFLMASTIGEIISLESDTFVVLVSQQFHNFLRKGISNENEKES